DFYELDAFDDGCLGIGDRGERLGEGVVAALTDAECNRAAAELGDLGDQLGGKADGAAALERLLETLEQDQAVLALGGETEQLDAGAQVFLRAGLGETL